MKLDRDFGEFLALALAIHCRDEVAVSQFIKQIASGVVNKYEEDEMQQARPRRSARSEDRLEEMMTERMKLLSSLSDADGMNWLRSMIHD